MEKKNVKMIFTDARNAFWKPLNGFTLVEMLMALLIVSVVLSASLPVITTRQKAHQEQFSRYNSFPIGGIIVWGSDKPLPDNTWLECNGQAIPNGIEYEKIRQIYGTNLPDYRGVFLRGYGSLTHTQNNGTTIGNTATTHTSGAIGEVQGDTMRNISGRFIPGNHHRWPGVAQASDVFYNKSTCINCITFSNDVPWTTFEKVKQEYGREYNDTAIFDSTRVIPTSNEIRPINKAVRYIVKVRR